MADWFDQVQTKPQSSPQPDWFDKISQKTTTPQDITPQQAAGLQGTLRPQDVDTLIENVARPTLPKMAGAAASGVAGPVGGVAAYTAVDALLQHLKSGESPGLLETLGNTALQAGVQKGGEMLGSGVVKLAQALKGINVPEFIRKYSPTASQALEKNGNSTLAGIFKFLEDNLAGGAKAEAQGVSGGKAIETGQKLAGQIAGRNPNTVANPHQLTDLVTGEMAPESVSAAPNVKFSAARPDVKIPFATDPESLDKLIANPTKLQAALTKSQAAGLGTNVREDLAGYRLSRVIQDASYIKNGQPRIDPDKLRTLWNDPNMQESNKILFKNASKSLDKIDEFLQNTAITQQASSGVSAFKNGLIRSNLYLFPAAVAHSIVTGSPGAALAEGGLVTLELGMAGIAKLLTKPQTADIMLRMSQGSALNVSQQYAARVLSQALSGTSGNLIKSDGSKIPIKFQDGQIQPIQ